MKYCEEFAALLDLYVDGELSEEENARVRTHLESCPGCRSYADGALAIRAAFPEVEETVVPEGFADGVMAVVRAEAAKKARPARKNMNWGRVLLPLAACFAVVVVLRAIPGGGSKSALPAAAGSTAAVDNAVPAGDSGGGQYSLAGIAPQMEEAAVPEALPESGVQPRITSGEAPSEPAAPTTEDAPAALCALPPEEYGSEAPSAPGKRTTDRSSRVIRLTADQAGDLLADRPYTTGEDGIRCYRLTREESDALLTALAERDIVPEEAASETEDLSGEYNLVYVTEE